MADWYVSSVAYAATPVFQISHAYVVGDIIRPTTSIQSTMWVFRVTTAGTSAASEPSWTTTNNGTTTSGSAVFTNVTAQSAYGWAAAGGNLRSIGGTRPVAGDRVFLSSDHSESVSSTTWQVGTAAFGLIQIISVNRAGSVPPVAADILAGATLISSAGNAQPDAACDLYWQGVTFSSASHIAFNSSGLKTHNLKNCALVLNNATSTSRIGTASGPAKVILDNTTMQFGATGQAIGASGGSTLELLWINTPTPFVGATLPTTLITTSNASSITVTCRGIDLSAITGTLLATTTTSYMFKVLLDSCKIASGVTRYAAPTASMVAYDEIELVNCYNGTSYISERHTAAGAVTTDFSTTLSGGAADDVGNYSHKLVSASRSDFAVLTLDGFWLDVENTLTGSSKTATIEIISSGSLNNNDIKLQLQYMGTAGSSLASFVESLATVLTPAAALSSSSATWNSPPATPQKQLLQVTFTPQVAGRVRGLVKLGKVSTTVWVNPQITIS